MISYASIPKKSWRAHMRKIEKREQTKEAWKE